jgi:hypothetical protein
MHDNVPKQNGWMHDLIGQDRSVSFSIHAKCSRKKQLITGICQKDEPYQSRGQGQFVALAMLKLLQVSS